MLAGLRDAGFTEHKNVEVEYRWAELRYERLPALAAELVKLPVDIIFPTGSIVSALAAKSATTDIPIVFANGSDPVQYGLVASLSRPGGNITGISFINNELDAKRIQLLRLLRPNMSAIALLVNPKNPNAADVGKLIDIGKKMGIQVTAVNASSQQELKGAFQRSVELNCTALLVHVDALFNDRGQDEIVKLAGLYRLPVMTSNSTYVSRGGLMSYGADIPELNRQAGVYVGRILRGEKPANLPVVQPTKFALRLNLRAAKALGINIPEPLMVLAEEVIE
jgi:putative ABC transport system substrate-binding protein